jgi:hypothetical protein
MHIVVIMISGTIVPDCAYSNTVKVCLPAKFHEKAATPAIDLVYTLVTSYTADVHLLYSVLKSHHLVE